MSLVFDDRKKCEWYCHQCKMGTWTQHKHGDYIGVVSVLKSSGFKRRKSKKLAKVSKKKGKKIWREYYKSIEFISKF